MPTRNEVCMNNKSKRMVLKILFVWLTSVHTSLLCAESVTLAKTQKKPKSSYIGKVISFVKNHATTIGVITSLFAVRFFFYYLAAQGCFGSGCKWRSKGYVDTDCYKQFFASVGYLDPNGQLYKNGNERRWSLLLHLVDEAADVRSRPGYIKSMMPEENEAAILRCIKATDDELFYMRELFKEERRYPQMIKAVNEYAGKQGSPFVAQFFNNHGELHGSR